MPDARQILEGLSAISNEAKLIAGLWHLVVVAGLVAAAAGWRPSRRLFAGLLLLPLVSVAVAAWAFANPFNGTTFLVLAAVLGALGLRLPATALSRAPAWSLVVGSLMICFGLLYPHFLENESPLAYLYAAPTGLVPCPTLSLVIGLALAAGGLGSRSWSLVLACAGLFYGFFGMLRLGVYLDVGLVAGAATLLLRASCAGATASGRGRALAAGLKGRGVGGRVVVPAQGGERVGLVEGGDHVEEPGPVLHGPGHRPGHVPVREQRHHSAAAGEAQRGAETEQG